MSLSESSSLKKQNKTIFSSWLHGLGFTGPGYDGNYLSEH